VVSLISWSFASAELYSFDANLLSTSAKLAVCYSHRAGNLSFGLLSN